MEKGEILDGSARGESIEVRAEIASVDARFAEEAELTTFGIADDELANDVFTESACRGDAAT